MPENLFWRQGGLPKHKVTLWNSLKYRFILASFTGLGNQLYQFIDNSPINKESTED